MSSEPPPTAVSSQIRRPDGVDISWESRGEGPLVLLAHHTLWSYPAIYADLIDDLSRDHCVVTYDPRGCGRSTRSGPYTPETDAADLEAIAEAAGGAKVGIAVGDAFNRVARVSVARPELIAHVLAIGPAPAVFLPRSELEGEEVLGASDSVIEMLMQMMTTDPRAALRTMLTVVNPDHSEEQLRERLDRVAEYLDPRAGLERARAWLADDVSSEAQRLGERLVIIYGGADPMFEGALASRIVELLPKARVEEVADGPITRPDITAGKVRELSA